MSGTCFYYGQKVGYRWAGDIFQVQLPAGWITVDETDCIFYN